MEVPDLMTPMWDTTPVWLHADLSFHLLEMKVPMKEIGYSSV